MSHTGYYIEETQDKGFIYTAKCRFLLAVKLSSSGDVVWQKCLDGVRPWYTSVHERTDSCLTFVVRTSLYSRCGGENVHIITTGENAECSDILMSASCSIKDTSCIRVSTNAALKTTNAIVTDTKCTKKFSNSFILLWD